MAGMDDPSALQAGGVYVGGQKYMFISSDDRNVVGKKVRRAATSSFFFFDATRTAVGTPPPSTHRPRPIVSVRRRRGATVCSCARRRRAWSSARTTRTSRAGTATRASVTWRTTCRTTACEEEDAERPSTRGIIVFFAATATATARRRPDGDAGVRLTTSPRPHGRGRGRARGDRAFVAVVFGETKDERTRRSPATLIFHLELTSCHVMSVWHCSRRLRLRHEK